MVTERHWPYSCWAFLPPGLHLRHHPALSHCHCRCQRRCWLIGVSPALSPIQSRNQSLKRKWANCINYVTLYNTLIYKTEHIIGLKLHNTLLVLVIYFMFTLKTIDSVTAKCSLIKLPRWWLEISLKLCGLLGRMYCIARSHRLQGVNKEIN